MLSGEVHFHMNNYIIVNISFNEDRLDLMKSV